jgi:DNA polymerase-1
MMFVGEAPGAAEDFTGIPFNGPSGDLLWEICRELGFDRHSVYTTNVFKYRPPQNNLKRLGEIGDHEGNPITWDNSLDQLWDEIQTINPNIIVALGNTPLKALTGRDKIMRWRGSVVRSNNLDYKVLATIHPAALLHAEANEGEKEGKRKGPLKYSYRHILKLDLARALKQSESRLYEPPPRQLEIIRDTVQLGRFLQLYGDRGKFPIVSVDIEVIKSVPFCIALAFNNWHAVSVPLLDVFKWQGQEGIADHELAEMWRMVAELLATDVKVIGQNFKFDQRQLSDLCGIRIRNFFCDTSLLAHALHSEFPKALEFTTSIYTEEPYYKEEGREFDWKRDKIERFLTYNARDAAVTYEVYEQMMQEARETIVPGFPNWIEEFIFGHQMKLHEFYYEMDDVGFVTNLGKQKEFVKYYDGLIAQSALELNQIAGWEVNARSPKHLAVLLYNQLKFPQRKGTGEDVLVALMANTKKITPPMRRACELILLIRRLRSARLKIGRRPDFDGRMKTVFRIVGTETGRSSTSIMKPPVRPEKMGIEFHTLTKHGDIGTEVREMLEADPGYVIVETDMSQAEARIVALFGRDKRILELFAQKADVHRLTASWIFGVKPEQITKELRFIGKTCRHAGNYDMGKHRLMELVNTEAKRQKLDVNISEYKAGKILDSFHAFSPAIRGVFHTEIQEALANNGRILVNPFGRYRQFYDRFGKELFKEAYAHLPQSTVPDAVRRAGMRSKVRFQREGIDARFVVEAHDALVGLVREKDVDAYIQIIHQEIEVPIDFSRCTISRGSLVIPAESKVGYNYKTCENKTCPGCKQLHDYKLQRAA